MNSLMGNIIVVKPRQGIQIQHPVLKHGAIFPGR